MRRPYSTLVISLSLLLGQALSTAPALAASPASGKTLRVMITTGETSMDPAVTSDLATLSLIENVFEPLLRYDYLARPVRLRPGATASMPEVSADGLTYTFQIRPGQTFTPDPVFKGAKREVTAADYLYSFKRLYDPAIKSPWLFLFDGKLAGDKAFKANFSQDAPFPGLQAIGRYTLRVVLAAPDPNFLFYVATTATGAVAREVVEAYGSQAGNHPVGSGPFYIGEWKRSDKIVLLANRDFTGVFHSGQGSNDALPNTDPQTRIGGPRANAADPLASAIAASLEGKRLPLVDRVEVKVMEEYQSRVLGFLGGELDLIEQVPESMSDMVLTAGKLKPELAQRGIRYAPFPVLQTYYMWMNMADPVLGGYGKDKVALRRAIALSYNGQEDVTLLKKGLAISAQSPLPPNVLGYDPAYRSPVSYDPAMANALLDRFGYTRRDPDGMRRAPDGTVLTLTMHTEASMVGRLRDELWRKCLHAIGLRVRFKSDKKGEIIKASRLGKVQMFETNWIADFPDGDNYFQLLYGPNSGRANYARFNLPEYNERYEKARRLPDSPERQLLYREMNQLIHAYNPWVVLTHPLSADLSQPWLKNYMRHPVEFTNWRYLDVDEAQRSKK